MRGDPPARRWSEAFDFLSPWLGGVGLPWWRWWRYWVHRRSDRADTFGAAEGPGATAAGPVPGLLVCSEREGGSQGWISCVPCSGVVVLANNGAEGSPSLNDAHAIRSGAGKPHSGGMTTGDLVNGVRAEYGLSLARRSRSDKSGILGALGQGWAYTVFHVYGKLPSNLRRWDSGFTGNHCATIAGRDGDRVGWFDPLATSGYAGEWVDIDVLLPAMFDDLYGYAGDDVKITRVKGQDWQAVGGPVSIYQGPSTSAPGYGQFPPGTIWRTVAEVTDNEGGSWRMTDADEGMPVFTRYKNPSGGTGTMVPYGGLDVDGELQAFIKRPGQPGPTPEPPGDYDEGYAAGTRDQWDQWAANLNIPDRPT